MIAHPFAAKMKPAIPPKRNRKKQRKYDHYSYRLRHLVKNARGYLKYCAELPLVTPR